MTRRRNNLALGIAKSLFVVFILYGYNIFSQPFTEEEKQMFEKLDVRSHANNNKLIEFFKGGMKKFPDPVLLTLINNPDTTLVEEMISIYKETTDTAKQFTILYCLGFLKSAKALEFLNNEFDKNSFLINKATAMISLSNLGGEKELNKIINYENPGTANNYLMDVKTVPLLQNFIIRKIYTPEVLEYLKKLQSSPVYPYMERYIAYCYFRIGNKEALTPYKEHITAMLESTDPYTRMWAYSALGKIQDTSTIDKMLYELDIDADWRVRVNICNALGNQILDPNSALADKVTTSLLQHAYGDNSAHISIVALQALAKLFSKLDINSPLAQKIKQEIQSILTQGKTIEWQIKAEALRTYAKIFKDNVKDELLSFFSTTDNYDLKAAAVGATGFMENPLVYKELRDSISADVQRYNLVHPNKDGSMIGSPDLAKIYRAFVESLAELDDRLDDENRNIIRLIFSEFASSKNPAITDVCLTNFQDSMYLKYRDETCQIMMFDYPGFKYPGDKDVTLMYIQAWDAMKYSGAKDLLIKNLEHSDYDIAKASADALKNITGKDYEKKIKAVKYRTDFDWAFIDKLGDKKIATIKTNRGDIKIKFDTEFAPFTVQNFVKLGEKGFYNNTIFHRVVPNFVIQGGDPTGTGYGGPGYSIRSEFSPLHFEGYYIGMASSGKDTEGSQFFITHSPQPHLDGRYTIFGKVTEGTDAVDKIQVGDVIESITFSAD